MPRELFEELVLACSNKHIGATGSYIEAAIAAEELTSHKDYSLEMLTEMLVGYLLQSKPASRSDIVTALKLYRSWTSQEPVNRDFSLLCFLFEATVALRNANSEGKQLELPSAVRRRQFLFG